MGRWDAELKKQFDVGLGWQHSVLQHLAVGEVSYELGELAHDNN